MSSITWRAGPSSPRAGLEVVAAAPPNGTNAFYLTGDLGQVHRLDLNLSGGLPTTVTMLVTAWAGAIVVEARDASGNLVDTAIVPAPSTTSVTLGFKGGIHHLFFIGGEQEDYVDDICLN
jgi:hypothetical protein